MSYTKGCRVYHLIRGKGTIMNYPSLDDNCLLILFDGGNKELDYTFEYVNKIIFHLGAITFDNEGRLISVDYNYRPKRKPKLKLGDFCLVRNNVENIWIPSIFVKYLDHHSFPYIVIGNMYSYKYCIPLEGNEHLISTCGEENE